MAEGDQKTLVFRAGAEFTRRYRDVDARIDAGEARLDAFTRAREADAAAEAAGLNARLYHEMNDLILDELECHWGPIALEHDPTRPEFPDNWCTLFYGRMLRVEYREREVFRRD